MSSRPVPREHSLITLAMAIVTAGVIASPSAAVDVVLDDDGKTVGTVDSTKTNCIGHACGTGGSLNPIVEPAAQRTSLKELFTALGFTCTAGISAKNCKAHCQPNEYMMLYVYILPAHNFETVRRKFAGKDPFNDPVFSSEGELDFHGLKGGESGYTYQGHLDAKANEKIKNFQPTDAKPDFFGNPRQVLGKYCCCLAPTGAGQPAGEEDSGGEIESPSDGGEPPGVGEDGGEGAEGEGSEEDGR